jgi:hypothetical protein
MLVQCTEGLTENVHETKRVNHVVVEHAGLLRVESCAAEIVGKLPRINTVAAVTRWNWHAALFGQKGGRPRLDVSSALPGCNEARIARLRRMKCAA